MELQVRNVNKEKNQSIVVVAEAVALLATGSQTIS
jgi:hypothetical protein